MKLSNSLLTQAVLEFTQTFIEQYQALHGQFPVTEPDEKWPSPCEITTNDEPEGAWRPFTITDELSFENIESALELELHQDIKTYFTTIYSDTIDATCHEGNLSLLFAWSADDFKRLQENIIGHVMMKKKLKQSITVFFAVTDDEENILSIDNKSGEVWVERVGCVPHKKIANSLSEFFQSLTPNIAKFPVVN